MRRGYRRTVQNADYQRSHSTIAVS